jgi:hypothetical protein
MRVARGHRLMSRAAVQTCRAGPDMYSMMKGARSESVLRDKIGDVTDTFKVLPSILALSFVAVLIARYCYHLSDGALVVGASVPLVSLFLVSRVLVALSDYQSPRRVPSRKLSRGQFASTLVCILSGLASATFALAAVLFHLLRIHDARVNAWHATVFFGGLCVALLLLSIGVAIAPLLPSLRCVLGTARPILREGLAEGIGCFLYVPTAFVSRFSQ